MHFKNNNKLKLAIGVFLLACFAISFLTSLFKYIQMKYKLSTSEIVLIRMSIILIVSVPLNFRTFVGMFYSKNFGINFLRNSIYVLTVYSWYFGVKNVQVSEAIVISFLTPFTSLILAGIFMKEKINKKIWIVATICFIGVLLTLLAPANKVIMPERISVGRFNFDLRFFAIIALFLTAFLRGIVNLLTKVFTNRGGKPIELTLLNVFLVFLSSIDVFFVKKTQIPIAAYGLIAVASFLYFAETWLYSKAYSLSDVSVLQPFDFSRVIFSSIISYFLLNESLSYFQIMPIGMIFFAYVYYFLPSKK